MILDLLMAVALISVAASVASPQHADIGPATGQNFDDCARTSGYILDLAVITLASDPHCVGREVTVSNARIDRIGDRGFWVSAQHARDQVFVVPAEGPLITVLTGETVSLRGEVRRMPATMRSHLYAPYAWDEFVYIYAYTVRPAWPIPAGKESSTGQ
jgi:hypothetical protein